VVQPHDLDGEGKADEMQEVCGVERVVCRGVLGEWCGVRIALDGGLQDERHGVS
jgi:hypothetical protein